MIAAWFVVQARDAHDLDRATAALELAPHPSPPQATIVRRLLGGASFLNPDTTVDLLRARLALVTGHRAQSARIAERVTRREPMNVEAWLVLAEAFPNLRVLRQAVTHVARLDPRR